MGGMPLLYVHDAVGVNCKMGSTTKNQGLFLWYMGYGVCVG